MRSLIKRFLTVFFLAAGLMLSFNFAPSFAEENTNNDGGTSISISPVSRVLQLTPSTTYDESFKVSNNGSNVMEFEVYAAPYSYIYSEEDDSYKLGFSRENAFTQLTRWITFRDAEGNYVEKAKLTAQPNSSVEVAFRIVTPESIPAGGQYAVLFAHTLSSDLNSTGIRTEASPGLVVYGRAEGETIVSGEASNYKINNTMMVDNSEKTIINASAKVKNTGNVDFMASGKLKVTGIFGQVYYETRSDSTRSKVSVIPESELVVSDSFDDTPFFGLFNAEWTVYINGEADQTITKFIVILPPIVVIIMLLLLTIIIIWITIVIRKRKERRAKFMV